ncbi:MAG: PadR family transcriptional regulator [Anaerolineales bacterium]|nr:MAG: PadR family transcriptional regulator [Anaerolineales bacterium]
MTNAELAILSLIAEQPRHGYEIEQVIEERGMREWTEIGFSSIYYLLKKLERDGLIEGQLEEAERGPARKIYHITQAGMEARRAGVLDALSVPRRCYLPLQLGLANLPGIPPAEALAALRQYRDELVARLEHVQARWESQRPLPYFVDAMFDHSVTMIQAELEWVTQFISQLKDQPGW